MPITCFQTPSHSVTTFRWLAMITCTLLLLFPHHSRAQQNNHYRDSLWRVLQQAKEDTGKISLYLAYGDLFRLNQPDSAVLFYDKAKKLATQFHSASGISTYTSHYIEILNNRGQFKEALTVCQQAIDINLRSGSLKDLARAYNNVANEYQYLGALSSAAEYYLKAMQIAENIKAKNFQRVLTNNLASVFLELQQYDKAFAYAATSNRLSHELHDTTGIAYSVVNMGVTEIHLQKTAAAMQHFKEAIQLGEYLGDYTLLEDGYLDMAEINTHANQVPLAIQQNQQALDLAIKNDNPTYKVLSLGGLADDYAEIRNWKKANEYVQQAITIARQIQDRSNLSLLYTRASHIQEGMGDYKGALEYKNKYTLLNDSLLNEKTRNHINDLETRFQTAQKDKTLAEQQLQLENTKAIVRTRNIQLWSLGIGLAVLLLVALLIIGLYRQRQKLNKQLLISLQKEQEVTVLKAVLDGQEQERQRIAREMHDDMGSGLTTILYLCQDMSAAPTTQNETVVRKIAATARTLTSTMNEIIWSMNSAYDTLDDLVAYIRLHASEMLENTSLHYNIQAPDELPNIMLSGKIRRNIYLVVKEALHNAIKHARASSIQIMIQVNDGALHINIHDNGQGITAGNERRFGNGLRNMQERMQTIGGSLDICSEEGTTVQLQLAINNTMSFS